MSTWIFDRRLISFLVLPLLAGCLAVPDVARRDAGVLRKPPETVAVANREVVIGGPPGYCVDRSASRIGGARPFVLLGSCASIAQDARAGSPRIPGILTASVASDTGGGPVTDAAMAQMERFLASPDGRAALARDGRADSVTVLSTRTEQGALFIHLRDTSENPVQGVADDYWRGLFDVNGRLVTVSVVSFADQPLTDDAGLSTLRAFLARILQETPQNEVADATRPGLLRGLFR